jgi:hypothetical protein
MLTLRAPELFGGKRKRNREPVIGRGSGQTAMRLETRLARAFLMEPTLAKVLTMRGLMSADDAPCKTYSRNAMQPGHWLTQLRQDQP